MALIARMSGAQVFVVESPGARRGMARELQFVTVLDSVDADVVRWVRRQTESRGADAVFDCSGNQALLQSSIDMAARGGTVVVVGLGAAPAEVDANRIVWGETNVVGSLGYRQDVPRAVQILAEKRIDPSPFITHRVSLAETPETFAELADRAGTYSKVLVRCNGSDW